MQKSEQAQLLYDGDCSICGEWVCYWDKLTSGQIKYIPYQQVRDQYENIAEDELARAIHLIEKDGSIKKGAEATFSLYKNIHPYSILIFLYRYLPGFALFSELGYRFFSGHRGILAFISHLFWGKNFQPSEYKLISGLFLRLLGFIYLVAFLSFLVQAMALIGKDGVLPLEYYLNAVNSELGNQAYFQLPSLFWISHSDPSIQLVCITGILASIILISGFLKKTTLILLYILYLSIVNAGQVFMTFQWDVLLLECGFLAIFLAFGSNIIVWLYRWLVFRFMFLGGVVKIASGDPSWDSITALNYHFETQPLPLPTSWYVHHLPEALLRFGTAATLIIELILPFFIFAPRRIRHVVAICFICFQTAILLTGNYNFFNMLTIFMCLFLFDDQAIKRIFPVRTRALVVNNYKEPVSKLVTGFALLILSISIYMSSIQFSRFIVGKDNWNPSVIYRTLAPFNIVNSYGPFAVMTTTRHEIILEGSLDRENWQEYQFKYKPGDINSCPSWVQPHQPRVDWQMWFAALSHPQQQRWLFNLMVRMLQDSEPVLDLFEHNPFTDEAPVSLRALYYKYTFTSPEERKKTGRCWNREYIGEYIPMISKSQ